jgi:hypothetical protein
VGRTPSLRRRLTYGIIAFIAIVSVAFWSLPRILVWLALAPLETVVFECTATEREAVEVAHVRSRLLGAVLVGGQTPELHWDGMRVLLFRTVDVPPDKSFDRVYSTACAPRPSLLTVLVSGPSTLSFLRDEARVRTSDQLSQHVGFVPERRALVLLSRHRPMGVVYLWNQAGTRMLEMPVTASNGTSAPRLPDLDALREIACGVEMIED